jgi:hypothetical protein
MPVAGRRGALVVVDVPERAGVRRRAVVEGPEGACVWGRTVLGVWVRV